MYYVTTDTSNSRIVGGSVPGGSYTAFSEGGKLKQPDSATDLRLYIIQGRVPAVHDVDWDVVHGRIMTCLSLVRSHLAQFQIPCSSESTFFLKKKRKKKEGRVVPENCNNTDWFTLLTNKNNIDL